MLELGAKAIALDVVEVPPTQGCGRAQAETRSAQIGEVAGPRRRVTRTDKAQGLVEPHGQPAVAPMGGTEHKPPHGNDDGRRAEVSSGSVHGESAPASARTRLSRGDNQGTDAHVASAPCLVRRLDVAPRLYRPCATSFEFGVPRTYHAAHTSLRKAGSATWRLRHRPGGDTPTESAQCSIEEMARRRRPHHGRVNVRGGKGNPMRMPKERVGARGDVQVGLERPAWAVEAHGVAPERQGRGAAKATDRFGEVVR